MLRISAGVILLMVGSIWILQGFDVAFAPESFMTDNRSWSVAGLVTVIVGTGLVWWGVRSQRKQK